LLRASSIDIHLVAPTAGSARGAVVVVMRIPAIRAADNMVLSPEYLI